jgi:ribulose-5-phosphate 4-epimerase/fuculose-1-phosphate aldolase
MADITGKFDVYLKNNAWPAAYLIEGHGVYAWGKSIYHAKQA